VGGTMASGDKPSVVDKAVTRFLERFTEQNAIRRWARGLAGELLLADHEGEIVDPGLDPRVFTTVPSDLAPERYAHATLLMGGEGYLPGCLVVGAALRWHIQTHATLLCLVDDSVPAGACDMLAQIFDRVLVVARLRAHDGSFPPKLLS